MKKVETIFILLFMYVLATSAQDVREDFQTYRKNMLSGYQGFRKSVLDDYAKFLNGIWKEYEVFSGRKMHPLPKPKVQPQTIKDEPAQEPVTIVPEEIIPSEPDAENIPTDTKPVIVNPADMLSIEWCGMQIQLPNANIRENLNAADKESLVSYIEILDNSDLCRKVLPQMANIAQSNNFNDWCLCLLIEDYVKSIKPDANNNTRNFIRWYMMAQFGYDVRLTFNGTNIFYLVPFQQQVYARSFITIHDIPYYLWGEGVIDEKKGISTPDIPDAVGESVNLVILKPLNIPYRAKRFTHTFAGRTLSVDVNENLIKVMGRFPQMPIPAYAVSLGDARLRSQLLAQMSQFVKGMNELDAANFILQFIQSFDYATDDEQFGYEKPFFVEETLYYPKCDCEDRAVLYHFLVTQLLSKDVHLVHYPNHECTAVNFSQELNADSYLYNGKQYVICDPTYIGATIGMCMPDFRNVKPEIELVR